MMMGAGLLFMLLIGLVVIAIPVLIAVSIAGGGGLAALFRSRNRRAEPDRFPPSREPAGDRNCPACGRTVQSDWNVCPSCGAALT